MIDWLLIHTCTIYTKGQIILDEIALAWSNLMFNTTAQDSIDIGDEIIIETPGTLDA